MPENFTKDSLMLFSKSMFFKSSSLTLLMAILLSAALLCIAGCNKSAQARHETTSDSLAQDPKTVRFATFNVSFNRKKEGQLKEELAKAETPKPKQIAEIIQRVRPDVILLNEFDFDTDGEGIASFLEKHLAVAQNQQEPIKYKYIYFQPVNTGVDSGMDLNADGKKSTPADAFGFGTFPGQYAMVILSKYEIDEKKARTFQKFLWKDMPDLLWPIDPATDKPFYSDEIKSKFRLSSKSHWDVPIKIGDKAIHFLVSHPTPPVFDGAEDRNGCRNHDEIRFFADYVTPEKSKYIYDDDGKKGGLAEGSRFVIAGDLNADEFDGSSADNAAAQLTRHPLINHQKTPKSEGGAYYAAEQGKKNEEHKGDPAFDTGDFNDWNIGNMHIDYCLPSKNLMLHDSGVFWPKPDQPGGDLVSASDHRLVWIDVEIE